MTAATVLAWTTRDPDGLATRLRDHGIEVVGGAFRVGPVGVRIEAGSDDRLLARPAGPAGDQDPLARESAGWAVLAVAWASVDSDRTLVELSREAAAAPQVRPRDESLGARVMLLPTHPVPVAVVEPDTEGRLAAMLARHGEGPAGLYLVRAGPDLEPPGDDGPFGWQRLLVTGSLPWSPVLLQVARRSSADPSRVPSKP